MTRYPVNADEQSKEAISLESKTPDYAASSVKALLGMVPFAGSLLAEVVSIIIPNQRLDRIAKFTGVLEQRLADIERDFVRAQLTDENFTDLLEEGIRQAARSVTDERRAYIASLVAHGIATENVEFIESKHILRILGEINDIEVLWLRYHLVPTIGGDQEFREQHSGIFDIPPAVIGGPQDIRDKNAMRDSYLQHLAQLGLLTPVYQKDMRSGMPEIDTFTGAPKLWHYDLASLGGLLLRHIGLTTDEGGPQPVVNVQITSR